MVHESLGLPKLPSLTLLGKRTKTVEKRIRSLVKRKKAFFLTTISLDGTKEETWFVDSGNWVWVEGKFIGHVKNCIRFFHGPHPLWLDDNRKPKRKYQKRSVSRGAIS